MQRGEVRWYAFASPDKKRPVLILTRDSILDSLGEVTVAPVTTTIRDIPSEVVLTEEDGMPRACAVNLDHVQTVAKGKLGPLITTLPMVRMQEVRASPAFCAGVPLIPSPQRMPGSQLGVQVTGSGEPGGSEAACQKSNS